MKPSRYLAFAVVLIVLGGCRQKPSVVTSPAPAAPVAYSAATRPAVAGDLTGVWSGDAAIVVEWSRQRRLPVRLEIAPDGTVTGTIGDARLVEAALAPGRGATLRSLGWGRDYRVHGKLQGDLIAAEQIRRASVDVVFDRTDDGTLFGGLNSSGSKFGGKDSMILSAGDMRLRRTSALQGSNALNGKAK